MPLFLKRRTFLASAAALGASSLLPAKGAAGTPERTLSIVRRNIEVMGRAASVYGIVDERGEPGMVVPADARFSVRLENDADIASAVHWHGQTPPPQFDGVEETGYAHALTGGEVHDYVFNPRPGTHWMHSHTGLLEQSLLAAPLIVQSAEDARLDAQDVTVMLHDFSFRSPEELLAGLVGSSAAGSMNMGSGAGSMDMGSGKAPMEMSGGQVSMDKSMGTMEMPTGTMDLNDVAYDAFLANDRTLDDPQIVMVERTGRVRLRIINGASATGFWIDLGASSATLVATDGNPVAPFSANRFPIAPAQRLDLLVPVGPGQVLPVLAQREGDRQRTGIILAAPGTVIERVSSQAADTAAPVDLSVESMLSATAQLDARPSDKRLQLELSGGMSPYQWTINGRPFANRAPLEISAGQRVEVEFANRSMMAHPMHLHGHHFQITSINGAAIRGPRRDTAFVPAMTSMTVAFDADNPGRWLCHCHNLYHMAAGMMTEIVYV